MERIIRSLATRPGDVVFDPFGGAGTTAIAAMKLGRKFVVTELDPDYVRITNEKLVAMRGHMPICLASLGAARIHHAQTQRYHQARD